MALAVGQSLAKRILLPMNHCDNIVAGASSFTVVQLIDNAVKELEKIL